MKQLAPITGGDDPPAHDPQFKKSCAPSPNRFARPYWAIRNAERSAIPATHNRGGRENEAARRIDIKRFRGWLDGNYPANAHHPAASLDAALLPSLGRCSGVQSR